MDALPCYTAEKNVRMFETHRVLSAVELRSRRDIGLDSYAKIINIEAETMLMMTRRQILPAVLRYAGTVASSLNQVRAAGGELSCAPGTLSDLCRESDLLSGAADDLESALAARPSDDSAEVFARYMHDRILPLMADVRAHADALERVTDKTYWPFPTYDELLFSVQ